MTTTTVRSVEEIARALGYRGAVAPRQALRLVRDIAAAEEATARNPEGSPAPLTLRAYRMVNRRMMTAEANLRKCAELSKTIPADLTNRSRGLLEFRWSAARGDIRQLTPKLARLNARLARLGIPRFMSDLTAAKVDAPAPDAPTDHRAEFLADFNAKAAGNFSAAGFENVPAHADEHVDIIAAKNEQHKSLRRERIKLDLCPACGESMTAW